MTPREELIEAMARAANDDWELLHWADQKGYREDAETMLAAIEAHAGGCVVVPIIPTEDQKEATYKGFTKLEAYIYAVKATPFAAEPKP